ncbi:MAG: response regulator transcription factor [Chloroflexi bacterium]|nr:response regulator transcription factor [Chloroflexota bacterium]
MAETIRILLADDHAIVRKGLVTLLNTEDGIDVVGEAVDGVDALEKALSLKPDVIILDMVMPGMTGLEVIQKIKETEADARILVLTSFSEDDQVFPAIKAGALGYLLKDSTPDQLLNAIHDVHRGESALPPAIALKVIRELNRPSDLPPTESPLTAREVEILKLLAQGLTNYEISEMLHISERTVGNHIGNILNKLHLANRTQAALYALRQGYASLD